MKIRGKNMRKYEMLKDDTKIVDGVTVYRIVALKDFVDVEAGDKGGYIESESCLEQEGTCWVYNDAVILGKSNLEQSARVYGKSVVKGNCYLTGDCLIFDNAVLDGSILVADNAEIYGNTVIKGRAIIGNDARIEGDTLIEGDYDFDDVLTIAGTVNIKGEDNQLKGHFQIRDNSVIIGGARINKRQDIRQLTGVLDNDGSITVYRTEDGVKSICRGLEYHHFIEIGSSYWESLKFGGKEAVEAMATMLKAFFW